MSLTACAEIVERGDPDRFRAIMAGPLAAREVLFALMAFNVEVTRAPWATTEPMIAEMRLQWWRDALKEIGAGGTVRRHEVVDQLAQVLDAEGADCLDGLIAARRWDIYSDGFDDDADLARYIDATTGNLLWTAARILGADDEARVRHFAYGVGVANLLRAAAELDARGKQPLVDGTAQGIAKLARCGLQRLKQGAAPKPVRLTGFLATPILKRAISHPQSVAAGDLEIGPFHQGWSLLRTALI